MPASLTVGDRAPDFTLPAGDGSVVSLQSLRGRKVVVFFYPRDNTPTCTKEACAFDSSLAEIRKKGAVVLGISADSVRSHRGFAKRFNLTFPLLSDPDRKVIDAYGVWKKKSMFGRLFMGIERATFVIDENGTIVREFRNVKVAGHTHDVLEAL